MTRLARLAHERCRTADPGSAIYMQQMQPALREYLTKLREDSYVNLAPGFVRFRFKRRMKLSPQFTAYVPPPVKKKKPKRRHSALRGMLATRLHPRKELVLAKVSSSNRERSIPRPVWRLLAAPKAALGKNGKPKKVKKEKIRFGQAPRTALQAGGTEDAEATQPTVGHRSRCGHGFGGYRGRCQLWQQTSSADCQTTNLDDNPLNTKAPVGEEDSFRLRPSR